MRTVLPSWLPVTIYVASAPTTSVTISFSRQIASEMRTQGVRNAVWVWRGGLPVTRPRWSQPFHEVAACTEWVVRFSALAPQT